MQLGEVIFGGVGSGLYGMLAFVIIAVFVSGLMVGRTPEYLGKKIEAYEMKMASIMVLIPPLLVKVGTAIAVIVPAARSVVYNPGPHGFSEILYAFSSASNNNGSAFAGLGTNILFYNIALGLGHALRTFLAGNPCPCHRRLAGAEEEGAGQRRDAANPHTLVHCLVDRCDHHRWSTELLPGLGLGTDC